MFAPTAGLPKNATAEPVKSLTFSNGLPSNVVVSKSSQEALAWLKVREAQEAEVQAAIVEILGKHS